MKIVAINGSPNTNGNTIFLLETVLEHCRADGAETKLFHVGKALMQCKTPFCTACSTPCSKVCYQGTLLDEIFEAVTDADAVIFGSPVYFGSMTAQLKAFFDKTRAIRGGKLWIGKPACAVSVGASLFGGEETTVRAIHDALLVCGMSIIGDSDSVYGPGHFGVLATKPAKEDKRAIKRCEILAKRIMSLEK